MRQKRQNISLPFLLALCTPKNKVKLKINAKVLGVFGRSGGVISVRMRCLHCRIYENIYHLSSRSLLVKFLHVMKAVTAKPIITIF
jgi:hypothetical protein